MVCSRSRRKWVRRKRLEMFFGFLSTGRLLYLGVQRPIGPSRRIIACTPCSLIPPPPPPRPHPCICHFVVPLNPAPPPKVASWINEVIELATRSAGEEKQALDGGEEGVPVSDDIKRLRDAATLSEFVPPLLALLPAAVKRLLTTFNAPGNTSGKVQDGVVLQAIQGTEVYLEVTRVERQSWASAGAGVGGGQIPHTIYASPDPLPPSSSTSPPPCPKETACGCCSRHVVSIVTYALLVLLHKRDDHGAGDAAGRGADGDSDNDVAEPPRSRSEPVWRKDPLKSLPPAVKEEAKHVAAMLAGLAEMGECEKCAQR